MGRQFTAPSFTSEGDNSTVLQKIKNKALLKDNQPLSGTSTEALPPFLNCWLELNSTFHTAKAADWESCQGYYFLFLFHIDFIWDWTYRQLCLSNLDLNFLYNSESAPVDNKPSGVGSFLWILICRQSDLVDEYSGITYMFLFQGSKPGTMSQW